MRKMLVLAVLVLVPAHSEESVSPTVRQKLHAKLIESLPLFQKPPEDMVRAEVPAIFARPPAAQEFGLGDFLRKKAEDGSAVVMAPFIVSESTRDLAASIAKQTPKEPFSVMKGGTIYSKDIGRVRMELGSWWAPHRGWSFLNFSW